MNEQQRLLAAIWGEDTGEFSAQGIAIYRRNLLANAQRALALSFPTIFELLDSNVSEQLAADFLLFSPPSQGDWGQWGAVFSAFISQHELSDDYAYLADCAALDWAVHQALHGTDTTLDSASLQQLADVEPAQLTVVINPNVVIMTSEYPLVDIFDAHHHIDEATRNDALHRAQTQLSDECIPCAAMVFRPEYQPHVCLIPESEAMFMQILIANKSLGEALDSMSDFPDFSFEQWLVKAIENNLIVRLATRS